MDEPDALLDLYSKSLTLAPAGWLSCLERCPIHQKVAGLIPGQGAQSGQPVDVCLSLPPFLSLSLSQINKRVFG